MGAFGLPSLLLVVVVVSHMGYMPIGELYANPLAAAKAWQYVLRGIEGVVLYLVVWSLTPWTPVVMRYAVSLVCAWGALESFQIAACRLALPMDRPPPKTPLYTGLCDLVTGWPIYLLTTLAVLAVALIPRRSKRED
jgi:hypothetical protein